MKRLYQAIFSCLLSVCLLGTSFVLPASALDKTRQNWFFKPNGSGRPELLGGSKLINDYDVIALGKEEKVIYLTFDAGYENGNVEKIVEALDKHGAKGAFFILPGLIRYAPDLVCRLANEGHTVCNHSTSHKDLSAASETVFLQEMHVLETQYRELTGRTMPHFFRPPEGAFSENLLALCKQNGYRPVFWSYAYADWDNNKQPDPEIAKQKILSNLHPGEVLLLHPTSATNAAILDDLLCEIESRGYRFGTLDEFDAAQTLSIDDYKQQGLVFSENRAAGKTVALTFDDGPHPKQTDEILSVLQKYGVRATFFPIGENVKNYPEVEKRVAAAGHEIGNHTYTHAKVSALTKSQLQTEISDTARVLKEQCGVTPVVFRPPGGCYCDEAIRAVNEMGYRYVLWAWRTDPQDWKGLSAEHIVNTVLQNVKGGDILLFHDSVSGNSHTAEALDKLIPALQNRGYSFVTVSELATF